MSLKNSKNTGFGGQGHLNFFQTEGFLSDVGFLKWGLQFVCLSVCLLPPRCHKKGYHSLQKVYQNLLLNQMVFYCVLFTIFARIIRISHVNPMFMIIQNSTPFITAVTPTAVPSTVYFKHVGILQMMISVHLNICIFVNSYT